MTNADILATITGSTGKAVCYVPLKTEVAAYGALLATPTVSTEATDKIAISGEAITYSGTYDGVSYSAGEMLTFTVTAQQECGGLVFIDVTFETSTHKETKRVAVRMAKWST